VCCRAWSAQRVKADFDVAIIGSGFSGSLLAMIARRLGHSVVLIERGSHPRFAIGESSTPLANLLLEEIAVTYDLPRLRPLCEWGSWQRAYPDVACGLKRGFTFYHHEFDHPWARRSDRANELLVAASPHDEVADTHWYRAEFDEFLVREAQTLGVDYLDETELTGVSTSPLGLRLEGTRGAKRIDIQARFAVDATGPHGFLHRAFKLPQSPFPNLPPIEGLFTHFVDVNRWDELNPCAGAPYPPDDSAVHHVFPGGWIWILRVGNGITSAGVAAVAGRLDLEDGTGWLKLLDRLPAVREQFVHSRAKMPFIHAANLPFRSDTVVGPNWALMPSAAGFVDPLLSTGFPLTLLGIQRLAEVLKHLDAPGPHLKLHQTQTLREVGRAAQLVAALYRNMDRPRVFNALTLLYFAAASFTETARRLGKPDLAGRTFLLGDHPRFGPAFELCVDLALQRADPTTIVKQVLTAIEPIDIAGLSDFSRLNSYGVFASDLRDASHKLNASVDEIDAMLTRCGFVANPRPVP
jgi:tetracycline 7-halogenase / FADH2 O2-dependent halogenase